MKKFLPILSWLAALLIAASALLIFEADFLWKLQESNLFLNTSMFFREQMVVPGGLTTWVATFFTQFFYYPWLGTVLLCGWWLLLMWVVRRAFRVDAQWTPLMLVPVGLLLLTIVDMGYWVYMLKLQGHAFVGTIATTAVAALLWAFRALPSRYYLRPVFILLTSVVGYPLMGIYGLGAALLMGIWSWRLKSQPIVCSLVSVVSVIAVPLLCYRLVYYQTNLANIYYAELPIYYITEEYHAYYVPFYLLALFFVVLTLVPLQRVKPLKVTLVEGVTLLALVVGVSMYWFKDENFHHEVAMQRCIEQADWQGVMAEAAKQEDEPTRAVVMMRNLALGRLGRQGEEMYRYPNGSKRYEAPFDMRLMLVSGPLVYYQYGMLNYSARLSTEMGVEFGWRAENLKMLARCAVVNGETQQARKYLHLLERTTFFGGWAEERRQLMGDSTALAAHPETGYVKRMMHFYNNLNSDGGNIESFLMHRIAESTYRKDPFFQEQTLLASLWTKDMTQFWYHFSDYLRLHPNDRLPRYYQEAAYLYGKLQDRKDIDRIPFDTSVIQSFDNFMQAAEHYNNAEVEVARKGLRMFSHTFYYDYYLMNQLPEY